MGENLLNSSFSPWGKRLLYSRCSGRKIYFGGKLLYNTGGYTSKMKKENRESLGSVIDQGDRSVGGDERETPACQFVFTLYNEVEALAGQQNKFELTDLILGVNRSLMEFIDKEHYRSDEYNKPWNIEPKIPICVDQLTKRLVLEWVSRSGYSIPTGKKLSLA
uniref:Uncharacterized protein n=1 Tax=Magallana gigas TaxID=29159 RepID=K1PFU9_MAGGI